MAAVTEVVAALESSLYPQASTSFSEEDLVDEWSGLDLERNTHVVREGDRVVGYGAVRDRGELVGTWDHSGEPDEDGFDTRWTPAA